MPPAADELRYEKYLADSYRPAFDGMRGICFLLVVTAHIPSLPLLGYLQGWTAVWPFLVMSGYLVTMLMMREEKSQGRVAFGPFLELLDDDPDLFSGMLCVTAAGRRL